MSDQHRLRAYYLSTLDNQIISLWDGYISTEDSNFHFARFYGINHVGDEIWVLERTEMPEGSIIIPLKLAQQITDMFRSF